MDEREQRRLERGLRRGNTTKLVLFIALAVSPLLYLGYRIAANWHAHDVAEAERTRDNELTPADRDELATLLGAAPTKIRRATEVWRAKVTRDQLRAIDLDALADAPRCALRLGRIAQRVPRGEPVPDSLDLTSAARELTRLADTVAGGDATRSELQQARALMTLEPSAILLVATDSKPFATLGSGPAAGFLGGRLAGDVFVYDFDAERVVCAGSIDAVNSPSVDTEYTYHPDVILDEEQSAREALQGALERDLVTAVERQVGTKLHVVR